MSRYSFDHSHILLSGASSGMGSALVKLIEPLIRKMSPLRHGLSEKKTLKNRPWRLFQVESAIACNLKCVMCPWREIAKKASAQGIMTAEIWEAIRPYLPQVQSVDFTGGGEPLLQPRLAEWIAQAKAVGCETGFLLWQLNERYRLGYSAGFDIVDSRRVQVPNFTLYDGIQIPEEDNRFDVVTITFVLHHVPNELKPVLLREVRRVSRRCVFVLEDTPKNFIDRLLARRHAENYRKMIGSDAEFGFYTKRQWENLFTELGFDLLLSRRLGRFCRNMHHPYARSVFVLGGCG